LAEQLDLSSALTTTAWRVRGLSLIRGYASAAGSVTLNTANSLIQVSLIGEHGRTLEHSWQGALADADIVALNKVNLTTNSLHKRILQKLITDGVIAGTISGTPD
jgi:hypothetical protein